MLNAGVIGMGVGEKHALAYENHQNTILKTVCDFDHDKLKELNTKFPNVCMETKDQSILKNEDIDIVSIASYDNYHCDQIIQALNNGKHVMAEKPLCMNREEMDKIHTAQKQNSLVKLSANHVLRSNSRFRRFKNDIQTGKFGEVYFLEGDYYWGRLHKLFEWRAEMNIYSIILGAAIHMVDLVMWLLDSPIQDGGQWDMFVNLMEKYGIVPQSVMPESHNSSNSRAMNQIITRKLREFASILRNEHKTGKTLSDLRKIKVSMMKVVFNMLCIFIGKPPQKFDWQIRNKKGKFMRFKDLTPLNFIWFKFGLLLGRLITPIIIASIYFLIVVPIAFLLRIFNLIEYAPLGWAWSEFDI